MKKLVLINAIVWATIILVSSFLFKDSENWKYFFSITIILAAVMNSLLSNQVSKNKKCVLK